MHSLLLTANLVLPALKTLLFFFFFFSLKPHRYISRTALPTVFACPIALFQLISGYRTFRSLQHALPKNISSIIHYDSFTLPSSANNCTDRMKVYMRGYAC